MEKEIKRYFRQQKTKIRKKAKLDISKVNEEEMSFSLEAVVDTFIERTESGEDVDFLSQYDKLFQDLGLIKYSYFHFPGSYMGWWEHEGYYVFLTERGKELYEKIKGDQK